MNSDILEAFMMRLDDAALGYPIVWPNAEFDPPSSGHYLKVQHLPNQPIDSTLANNSVIRRGLFQVTVVGKPREGAIKVNDIAAEVAAVFPKLTEIANVRVNRVPYTSSTLTINDVSIELPLTIEYSD